MKRDIIEIRIIKNRIRYADPTISIDYINSGLPDEEWFVDRLCINGIRMSGIKYMFDDGEYCEFLFNHPTVVIPYLNPVLSLQCLYREHKFEGYKYIFHPCYESPHGVQRVWDIDWTPGIPDSNWRPDMNAPLTKFIRCEWQRIKEELTFIYLIEI